MAMYKKGSFVLPMADVDADARAAQLPCQLDEVFRKTDFGESWKACKKSSGAIFVWVYEKNDTEPSVNHERLFSVEAGWYASSMRCSRSRLGDEGT